MKPPISSSVALTACGTATFSASCRACLGASSDCGPISSADSAAGAVARRHLRQRMAHHLQVERVQPWRDQRRRQADQLRVIAVARDRLAHLPAAVQQLAVEMDLEVGADALDVQRQQLALVAQPGRGEAAAGTTPARCCRGGCAPSRRAGSTAARARSAGKLALSATADCAAVDRATLCACAARPWQPARHSQSSAAARRQPIRPAACHAAGRSRGMGAAWRRGLCRMAGPATAAATMCACSASRPCADRRAP